MTDDHDDELTLSGRFALAIDEAIGKVLEENGGGFVTGYAAVIDVIDSDGARAWATCYPEAQSPITTLGLLRWQEQAVAADVAAYFTGDPEP